MYDSKNKQTISDFSEENIEKQYNKGFVLVRTGKGAMDMTQSYSIRIDLSKFELSSENKRIMAKVPNLDIKIVNLPDENYDWAIGKTAQDFFDILAGSRVFSANKIKYLVTNIESNFNRLFVFLISEDQQGWCIAYESKNIIHYSYPFYKTKETHQDMGLAMMTKVINRSKEKGKKYVYLGSASRYKLQFKGLEWFDGEKWNNKIDKLKDQLKNEH